MSSTDSETSSSHGHKDDAKQNYKRKHRNDKKSKEDRQKAKKKQEKNNQKTESKQKKEKEKKKKHKKKNKNKKDKKDKKARRKAKNIEADAMQQILQMFTGPNLQFEEIENLPCQGSVQVMLSDMEKYNSSWAAIPSRVLFHFFEIIPQALWAAQPELAQDFYMLFLADAAAVIPAADAMPVLRRLLALMNEVEAFYVSRSGKSSSSM